MEADFFRSECLEPPVVLRLRLRRFTLGHFLLLCELDSPYRPDAPREDVLGVHLMVAVFLCAQDQSKALAALCKWWVAMFFRFWSWRCWKCDPTEAERAFRTYLQSATKGPKVTVKQEGGRELAAPSVYRLWRFALEELNQPHDKALEMPLDQLMSLWATHADYHVGVSVWDARREALWEYARKNGHAIQRPN